MQSLPGLLRLQQAGGSIPRQKVCNLLCTLETVQLLLGSPPQVGMDAGQPPTGRDGCYADMGMSYAMRMRLHV